ncbi:MAG TPA: cytochrome c oxidase subunit II [Acetobacteraceae bacterium]|jgi:cytochrome c oxidase subunit 2|nr:cytochrome c oxidase subunit II [Acetobacteraceae bacterium]
MDASATWQTVLAPMGPQAAQLSWLLWSFIAVCGIIWLLVMLVLMLVLRRRSVPPGGTRRERRAAVIVGVSLAASVLTIIALSFMSYAATRDLSVAAADPLVIRLRGYQWWWEVTYADRRPDRTLVTANEIHIPVGRPVRIELSAADVIHSFWVPNLAGKQDLIPGRSNDLTFVAARPGVYRGQCAEFCGLQHAHMALLVIADEPAAFDAWRDAQLQAARSAETVEQRAGRDFFTSQACAACHTVRGTSAAGTLGPDLTHVASRHTIAAGLLPTTRGSLAAWIADPQTIKPGNNMPMVTMTADQLRAVSAWLAELR